jgi:hypothetical protein
VNVKGQAVLNVLSEFVDPMEGLSKKVGQAAAPK